MAKVKKRMNAQKLRKKGLSIGDIAKTLKVSKSSVSLWCRDVVLTDEQQNRISEKAIEAGHRGRMIGARMNKENREKKIEKLQQKAYKEIGKLSERDLLMLGTALYWGEGSKNSGRFEVINSDPKVIKTMQKFITDVLRVPKSEIRLRVQINLVHKPRINEIIKFWKDYLNFSENQIGNPYYIKKKPKKLYPNYDSYYGIARLSIVKSTDLLYKTLGYIDAIT